jgi:hypothetical protein
MSGCKPYKMFLAGEDDGKELDENRRVVASQSLSKWTYIMLVIRCDLDTCL